MPSASKARKAGGSRRRCCSDVSRAKIVRIVQRRRYLLSCLNRYDASRGAFCAVLLTTNSLATINRPPAMLTMMSRPGMYSSQITTSHPDRPAAAICFKSACLFSTNDV